jgi:aryl-alcohol dehydrogenase-like predicted oxidoreductase
MQKRELGTTGISVSAVGFGAWGIGGGWGDTEDTQSVDALNTAMDLGVTLIDTAYAYGDGRSERIIGEVVRARSEDIVIATKVPPANREWPARADTTADVAMPAGHIRSCTEESLRRLGMDSVDLQQIHVWNDRWLAEGSWLDEVAELKSRGLIRAFGISINDHSPDSALEAVASGLIDSVQVIYNIFDQSPQDRLLPACVEHGVGVIVRVALDEGGLTGTMTPQTTFATDDWRSAYFRDDRPSQVAEHVDAIVADLGIATSELPELALRFVLSNPAVSSVIPGMRRATNVQRNVAVGDGVPLSPERLEALARHRWVRNFYQ